MLVTSDVAKLGISKGARVLVLFPHPDDEAFFTSGLVQKSVKAGADVRLVSMTKGENSTLRHGVKPGEDLGEVRSKEFNKVCSMFGKVSCCTGSYPDGGLDLMEEEVVRGVRFELDTFKPGVIVTYEPSGVYGHPDHVFLSKVVTELVIREYPDIKIIYATVPSEYKPLFENIKMAKDPDEIRPLVPNTALSLSPSELFVKFKVFWAYKSQMNFKLSRVARWFKYRMVFREFFVVGDGD